jgi:hypothetical protein
VRVVVDIDVMKFDSVDFARRARAEGGDVAEVGAIGTFRLQHPNSLLLVILTPSAESLLQKRAFLLILL